MSKQPSISARGQVLARSRRVSVGLTLLTFAVATLLIAAIAGASPVTEASFGVAVESAPSAMQQEKKKGKKQRGKTVKARMVPSEPVPAEEAEEAAPTEIVEPAASAAAESTPSVEAEPVPESKSEPEPTRAERRASRKAADAEAAAQTAAQTAAEPRATRSTSTTAEPTVTSSTQAVAAPATPAPAKVATPKPTPRTPKATPAAVPAASRVAADPPRRSRTAPPTRPRDVVRDQVMVREVLLDVLVNDKKGNPIAGLGPADFTVTENGERREVTSVTFYGGDEFSGSGREGEARTDRYFIFMFHDLKQANPQLTASQIDAGRWATKWLDDGMLPNDQIAVVGYDVRLKLYQDFSRDRNEIAEAILAASRGGKDPDRWKSRSAPVFDSDSPSLFVNLPTGITLSKATPKIQQALELVGNAAEGIAGRKNLVLFSLGFGETRGSFGNYVPDPRYYPPMEQALNNGNVAVYTINTLGARRGGNTLIGATDALSVIAQDTGGRYYSNHTNVKTPLKQVAKDNAAYYLISYRTEYPLGGEGYQEVEVEANAPNAKVRARQGYRFGDQAEP